MPLIIGAKSASAATGVANSCRFNSADTPSITKDNGTPSSETTGTISFWLKRCILSVGDEFVLDGRIDANNRFKFAFNSSDIMEFWNSNGGSDDLALISNRKFRDVSAWYHFVIRIDTTQSTAADRVRVYVNGVNEADVGGYSTETYPAQDSTDTVFFEDSAKQTVGAYYNGSAFTYPYDGYLAEVVYCDGQSLAPTEFGEFDEDSPTIWKPKDVSGLTFGNNGFYLDFEDSADLGADVSGNSNDLTVVNLDATDQATDTPTNNFAVMNPLSKDEMTFSEGNCKVVTASDPRTDDNARGTMGVSSGKWYWEVKGSGGTNPVVAGICFDKLKMGSDLSGLTGVYAIQNAGATYAYKRENGTTAETTGFPNPVNDNIINVAFDADNAKLYIGINGTYYNQAGSTGDPAAGSNETFSSIDTSYFWLPFIESRGASQLAEMNFGGCPAFTVSSGNADGNGYGNFEYAVPSGYYALCTKNLGAYGG